MLINHSQKIKLEKVSEAIARHHNGTLPKGEYASNGHLYGKGITGSSSDKNQAARNDARKDQEASIKRDEFIRQSNEDMQRIRSVAGINQMKKKYY